jgi:hypothetical protein
VHDLWVAEDQEAVSSSVIGFSVQARDGGAGKVDDASSDVGACCIVVATGRLFRVKVILPAGMIERLDHAKKRVYVKVTQDQLKSAPEYEPIGLKHDAYKARIASYYLSLVLDPRADTDGPGSIAPLSGRHSVGSDGGTDAVDQKRNASP